MGKKKNKAGLRAAAAAGNQAKDRHNRRAKRLALKAPRRAAGLSPSDQLLSAIPNHPPPKIKHHSYFELVKNHDKKAKLESQITRDPNPPPGYMFVKSGQPELTTACKEISRERGDLVLVVLTNKASGWIGDQLHRLGHHFKDSIVVAACHDLRLPLPNPTEEVDRAEPIPLRQTEIDTQADAAIRDLFPRIPNTCRGEILNHAFNKAASKHRTVGFATNEPLARRVNLAVWAHVRHAHTTYDELLRKTDRNSARQIVEPRCLEFLRRWRSDDETGRNQQDEIFREVIVISDTETGMDSDDVSDSSTDDDSDDSSELSSDEAPTRIQSAAAPTMEQTADRLGSRRGFSRYRAEAAQAHSPLMSAFPETPRALAMEHTQVLEGGGRSVSRHPSMVGVAQPFTQDKRLAWSSDRPQHQGDTVLDSIEAVSPRPLLRDGYPAASHGQPKLLSGTSGVAPGGPHPHQFQAPGHSSTHIDEYHRVTSRTIVTEDDDNSQLARLSLPRPGGGFYSLARPLWPGHRHHYLNLEAQHPQADRNPEPPTATGWHASNLRNGTPNQRQGDFVHPPEFVRVSNKFPRPYTPPREVERRSLSPQPLQPIYRERSGVETQELEVKFDHVYMANTQSRLRQTPPWRRPLVQTVQGLFIQGHPFTTSSDHRNERNQYATASQFPARQYEQTGPSFDQGYSDPDFRGREHMQPREYHPTGPNFDHGYPGPDFPGRERI